MGVGQDSEHAKIKEAFAAYFKDFGIHLPDDIQSSGGLIDQAGWNIRYGFGRDGGRSFLELYAMNLDLKLLEVLLGAFKLQPPRFGHDPGIRCDGTGAGGWRAATAVAAGRRVAASRNPLSKGVPLVAHHFTPATGRDPAARPDRLRRIGLSPAHIQLRAAVGQERKLSKRSTRGRPSEPA